MYDKAEFEVCRLCLNSRGLLMNVFGENSKLQFMLEKTIEDLIGVKVVEDANFPWLVCSTCMEKLTEFRLFKRRCAECLSVFYNRIPKGCNPAKKDWITNGEEFAAEINKEFCDDPTVSGAVDKRVVDVPDGMIIVKEEFNATSECSASPIGDIDSSMVPSMKEGCSHWSDNEEAGNLANSQDGELRPLPFNEKVVIKEEWDIDVPREGGGQEADLSQELDGGKGQDGVGNILHTCHFCKKGFAQKDILEAHIMLLHPVKAEEIKSGIDAGAIECTSDVEADAMTYKCSICSRAFSQKQNLKRHMLLHSGERPYKCDICLKGFLHKQQLKGHMLTHTGERPHKCEICAKTFTFKQHLRDHIRIHTGEKSHKCEVCSKAFTMKQQLTEHRLTHSGARPHKCEVCSKAFKGKQNLKRHILIHTSEFSHKCEVCLKGFHHKKHLECHMLSHTGERPYKCEVCPKTFTLKQTLKLHMCIHTGEKPHKCEVCSKAFLRKQHLKEHMSNHRDQPHQCDVCSRIFSHRSSLKRHMKVHMDVNRMPMNDYMTSNAHSLPSGTNSV